MDNFTTTLDPKDYAKLMNALSDLSSLEREAIIAKGIQEGLKMVVQQGKQNLASSGIKVRKGNLSHSFKVLTRKKDLKGYAGFSRPKGAAAHLLDKGTKKRYTKTGANRGTIQPSWFWTNAVKDKSGKAQQELMESVRKSIENIMKRNQ